jgi:hypothetical protein
MKKPYLVIPKVQKWYMDNRPEDVLLAKLDDGTIPVTVVDDGIEQKVYLSMDEGGNGGITELEVEILSDLEFKAVIVEDGVKRYTRIFRQPEKDAWIEWREVDEK